MQKIKCIILEDEPLAIRLLTDYIVKVPYLELCGAFKEAISAANFLRQASIDLIFLDIHLPKLKGFSFLRTLETAPAIIVTTAYHQYAVEGFELNVADYLLKPFSFERFLAALNKVSKLQPVIPSPAGEDIKIERSLYLTVDRKKVRIDYENIFYVESMREYVKITTLNKEYISKISTAELQALLPAAKFTRIHRSFIVANEKVDTYTRAAVEIKGRTIPIGKGFKAGLLFNK